MKRTGLLGWVALLSVAVGLLHEAGAAGRPATVRGPERAFVRRGPGTEFTPFATVENGEKVQVEEVTGSWALVRTPDGQNGYVHASFLFYPDSQPVLVPSPTAGPPGSVEPAAAGAAAPAPGSLTPAATPSGDPAQRAVELALEVETLRRELESLRKGPAAVPSPGEDLVALRAEVRRLADVTDALRSRLDAPSGGAWPAALAPGEEWATSTVVVLTGCALLLGWVIGGILARREERGRRNRIRF